MASLRSSHPLLSSIITPSPVFYCYSANMSKPESPANFMAWKRAEVMAFFTRYDELEEEEIQKIETLWLDGSVLPDLSVEALIQGGMPLGFSPQDYQNITRS